MIKSLDHNLFFVILSVARGCGLEQTYGLVFVVLAGTSKELEGPRVFERICKC